MTYTELIFALYGTLVDIHTDENDLVWEKTALYLSFHGAPFTGPKLKAAFLTALEERAQEEKRKFSHPDIPFEQIMAQWFRRSGVKENADTLAANAEQFFRITSMEYIRLYPGVHDALSSLRRQGCRLWLLTNAQRVFTWNELCMLGLDSVFDGIYISSDYGCRKPDPFFFRALLDEQNLDPTRCLMIGNDRNTDIAGAQGVGLATLYLHTNLTPWDQEEANPSLLPGKAPVGCRQFEYEGWNWAELARLIPQL